MNISNKKTFKANLSTIKKSGETVREAIQNAVIQALSHYQEHFDTAFLSLLMEVAKANKGIRTVALQGFIQAHANVSYSKIVNKAGEVQWVFKKAGDAVEVVAVGSFWYDHDKEGLVVKDIDYLRRCGSAFKKAVEHGVSVEDIIALLSTSMGETVVAIDEAKAA